MRYLRDQLNQEREARQRADTVIAQLSAATADQARTIRALEAPNTEEASESDLTADSPGPRGKPSTDEKAAQEPLTTPSSPLRGWYVAVLVTVISLASFAVALYLAVTLLS